MCNHATGQCNRSWVETCARDINTPCACTSSHHHSPAMAITPSTKSGSYASTSTSYGSWSASFSSASASFASASTSYASTSTSSSRTSVRKQVQFTGVPDSPLVRVDDVKRKRFGLFLVKRKAAEIEAQSSDSDCSIPRHQSKRHCHRTRSTLNPTTTATGLRPLENIPYRHTPCADGRTSKTYVAPVPAISPYLHPASSHMLATHDLVDDPRLAISSRRLSHPLLGPTCAPRHHVEIVTRAGYFRWTLALRLKSAVPTVGDFLTSLGRALRCPVTCPEFEALPEKAKERVVCAFRGRCQRFGKAEMIAEHAKGVKRVDFLTGLTKFRGVQTSAVGPWELLVA
ncbi:hypothetical protein CYLTODRAFT_493875 [Cylindrobasidium torrendii FP15055 ss-10]|uniref:DUF6699 domain-containing protein n=1 Tax=Cylindrobasidium torrendii FP15055 ss-10 TaxID=1314674 RepID=A0A0D7AZ22_9AGAR|nr:hypothetical protein CYLTODRAFT_493875 [Cylindrobasidium torrendii FP15055 ss-10]